MSSSGITSLAPQQPSRLPRRALLIAPRQMNLLQAPPAGQTGHACIHAAEEYPRNPHHPGDGLAGPSRAFRRFLSDKAQ